jgi:hypothetical protein
MPMEETGEMSPRRQAARMPLLVLYLLGCAGLAGGWFLPAFGWSGEPLRARATGHDEADRAQEDLVRRRPVSGGGWAAYLDVVVAEAEGAGKGPRAVAALRMLSDVARSLLWVPAGLLFLLLASGMRLRWGHAAVSLGVGIAYLTIVVGLHVVLTSEGIEPRWGAGAATVAIGAALLLIVASAVPTAGRRLRAWLLGAGTAIVLLVGPAVWVLSRPR